MLISFFSNNWNIILNAYRLLLLAVIRPIIIIDIVRSWKGYCSKIRSVERS